MSELVRKGDDAARAPRVGHVDAWGAGLVEARAVGAGSLALANRPLDPALSAIIFTNSPIRGATEP